MTVAASNAGFALAGMCLGGAGGLGAVWAKATTAVKMKIGSLNPNDGMYHICSILTSIVDDIARASQFRNIRDHSQCGRKRPTFPKFLQSRVFGKLPVPREQSRSYQEPRFPGIALTPSV